MGSEKKSHSVPLWFIRHNGRVDGPYLSSEIRHQLITGVITLDDMISEDRLIWQALGSMPEMMPLEFRAEQGDRAAKDSLEIQRKWESGEDERRGSMHGVWFPFISLVTLAIVAVVVITWLWEPPDIADPQCDAPPAPGVDWRYCRKSGESLAGSDLSGANLTSSYLQKSNFSGANFQQTTLNYSNLSGADLSYSDMSGANLKGANLTNSNLTYSNLTSTNLSFADLTGANLGGAKFDGTRLDNAIWKDGQVCTVGSIDECRSSITHSLILKSPSRSAID